MICVRTPLRIGLFGGGTDIPDFFLERGGKVIGFAIESYIYVQAVEIEINQGFKFRLSYKTNEEVNSAEDIIHPIFREVLKKYKFDNSYHFSSFSNLPSGAGLGGSSSFTVGLLSLINKIKGLNKKNLDLAKQAINIERVILNEKGGWQDQLHAAFGGMNIFNFSKSGNISRTKLNPHPRVFDDLNNNMYLLYSGKMRVSHDIEASKIKTLNFGMLSELHDIANQAEDLLNKKDCTIQEIGKLLNDSWLIKRGLSNKVSDTEIDNIYKNILNTGAYGAKLCGAGGGGFFMVLASKSSAKKLQETLNKGQLKKISIDLGGIKTFEL
jgi:D-glycero-alpha-D-manno-heptose-7-phosphate kinase